MTTQILNCNSFAEDPTNAVLPSLLRATLDSYCTSKLLLTRIDMAPEVRNLANTLNAVFEKTADKALIRIKEGYESIHKKLALEALLKSLDTDGSLMREYNDKFGTYNSDVLYQEYANDLSISATKAAYLNFKIAKNLCDERGTCDGELLLALDGLDTSTDVTAF